MAPSTPVRIVDGEGKPVTNDNPLPTSATLQLEGGLEIEFPEGLATAAKQDAIIGGLIDIETEVETIAGAVDGTEVQVDVVTLPALPAGNNNIGDVDVASITLPSTVYAGQTTVTTPGTEVALSSSQVILSGVTIKALPDNEGDVYVGPNGLTSSTGFVLSRGEQVFLEISNLAAVFIDAENGSEGVSWIAT